MKVDYTSNSQTVTFTHRPIYQMRLDRHLTQAKLARKLGMSQAAVARAEQNEKRGQPSLAFWHKAANAMGAVMEMRLVPRGV